MCPARRASIARLFGRSALVGLVLVSVGACARNPDVDSRAATQGLPNLLVSLTSRDWHLDPAASSVPAGVGGTVTLDFHADRTATGTGPCNVYRGAVALGDHTVTISDITTTLRSCDPATNAAEKAYLAVLGAVRDVDVSDPDRLVLTGSNGQRLSYNGFNPYEAIVKTWHVVNLATGDALASPPPGVDPRLTFAADHTFTIETGCPPIAGTWALDDDQLQVTNPPILTVGCPNRAQEDAASATLTALRGTHRVNVTPTTLTLLTSAGTISLIAIASPGP